MVNYVELVNKCRVSLWGFGNYLYSQYYQEKYDYLKQYCKFLTKFNLRLDENKSFYFSQMPPRSFKTFTILNSIAWSFGYHSLIGEQDNYRVLYVSATDNLGIKASNYVKQLIRENKFFKDCFPDLKLKFGRDGKELWKVEGSTQDNFRALGINSSVNGDGFTNIYIDDIIGKSLDAFNENLCLKHKDIVTNTLLTRGNTKLKILINQTRWSDFDIYAYMFEEHKEHSLSFTRKVKGDNGNYLHEECCNKEREIVLRKALGKHVYQANYNQKIIPFGAYLYQDLNYYDELPKNLDYFCYVDPANEGDDYFCAIIFGVDQEENRDFIKKYKFVIDVIYTKDDKMDITIEQLSKVICKYDIEKCIIEKNNAQKFVDDLILKLDSDHFKFKNSCDVKAHFQSLNKKSRLKCYSSDVMNLCKFPNDKFLNNANIDKSYNLFMKHITKFPATLKAKNDDCADALTGVVEHDFVGWTEESIEKIFSS